MSRTVLIVDEDVNARIIAETLLRLRGFEVRTAGDGPEACEIVGQEHIGLVVSDLNLPGMNGFELIRRLRSRVAIPPFPSIPRILVVTSREEPEVERFVLHLGADAFLRKPFPLARFIATVENLLESEGSQTARAAGA